MPTGPHPAVHGENNPGCLHLYIDGVEHAVLHLLYSRFWHKVSLKNSVAPDEIARDYDADTLRVYEMSMGPLDQLPGKTVNIVP